MTHLTPIGNSFGVRIPKAVLTQVGFDESTDLAFEVTKKGLLIAPVHQSRKGWAEAFQSKQKRKTKSLLMGENIINKFDQDEWEW
jgi:antitoxin MazE